MSLEVAMCRGWLVVLLCVAVCRGDDETNTFPSETPQYETIVVGMGAAGVAASSELAKAGRRVLALEARDRIGGRVWTIQFGDGVVEVGAEWIHGTVNSSVYEAATSSGVLVKEQEYNVHLLRKGGTPAKQGLNQLILAGINMYLEDMTVNETVSVGTYVSNRIRALAHEKYPTITAAEIEEALSYTDLLVDAYEGSNSWYDVNARNDQISLGGHQSVGWGRSGYKTLFDILLGFITGLGGSAVIIFGLRARIIGIELRKNKHNNGSGLPSLDIRLNSEVTSIRWSAGAGVTVSTKDRSYRANNVIVTLPLGVLKERHSSLFDPPLPADKVEAIEVLPFGVIGKIVLPFDAPWWDTNEDSFSFIWSKEEVEAVPAEWRWITRVFYSSCPLGATNVITLWTAGDTAKLVETLPPETVIEGSLRVLRQFIPSNVTIPQPTSMIRTRWFSDPLSRGTYSYDGVRNSASPRARRALLAPLRDYSGVERVLFAGEATHLTRFSNVHGAVDSGYREARRLLGTLTAADQYE